MPRQEERLALAGDWEEEDWRVSGIGLLASQFSCPSASSQDTEGTCEGLLGAREAPHAASTAPGHLFWTLLTKPPSAHRAELSKATPLGRLPPSARHLQLHTTGYL